MEEISAIVREFCVQSGLILNETTEQSMWRKIVIESMLQKNDVVTEAVAKANLVVDEYRKKFQVQRPAQQE